MRLASIGTVKTLLDLNDDVLYLICVQVHEDDQLAARFRARDRPPRWLHRLSMSCKRLRDIASPLLYRKVTYTEGSAIARHDRSPTEFLDVLESSVMYRKRIRILNINSKNRFEDEDCRRLIELLPTLVNVETSELVLPRNRAHVLRELSRKRFPAITTLTLTLHHHAAATSFPNAKIIGIENLYHWDDLVPPSNFLGIPLGSQNSTIRHLDIDLHPYPGWNTDLLRYLATLLPQLRHLGTVAWGEDDHAPYCDRYEANIRSLAHFTLLEMLSTDDFEHLGAVDWILEEPFAHCNGCVYDRGSSRPCSIHQEEAMHRVLRLAFEACATLQEVWVSGSGVVRCERDTEGIIRKLTWLPDAIPPNPFA